MSLLNRFLTKHEKKISYSTVLFCNCICPLVSIILNGIFYFGVETRSNNIDDPNYCVVDSSVGTNVLAECAAERFSNTTTHCRAALNPFSENAVDVAARFNFILGVWFYI